MKDTADLQGDIDSLLKGVDATAARIQKNLAPDLSMAADLNHLIAADPELDPVRAVEHLDAQLAELTNELLSPAAGAGGVRPVEAAPEPLAEAEPDVAGAEPDVAAAEPEAPAPEPQPSAPPSARVDVTPPAAPATAEAAAPPIPHAIGSGVSAGVAVEQAAPAGPGPVFRVFERLSRPLKSRPAVRLGAGFLGVQSLLLAGGVWAWVSLRPAPAPVPAQPFDLTTGTLPRAAGADAGPARTPDPKPAKGGAAGH